MTAGREVTPQDAASTRRLKDWWIHSSGIPWGTPGDFDECVVLATKVFAEHDVHIDPKAFCSNIHLEATGGRPGHAPGERAG
jgi:hypothetical protein